VVKSNGKRGRQRAKFNEGIVPYQRRRERGGPKKMHGKGRNFKNGGGDSDGI